MHSSECCHYVLFKWHYIKVLKEHVYVWNLKQSEIVLFLDDPSFSTKEAEDGDTSTFDLSGKTESFTFMYTHVLDI